MAFGKPRSDRAIANLVNSADKAFATGNLEEGGRLLGEATDALVEKQQHDEAIDLCLSRRDYGRAASVAAERKDYNRAAQLWFRAGDFMSSARARMKLGEYAMAAELFERCGDLIKAGELYARMHDYVRAAGIFERSGHKRRAADLLVQALADSEGRRVLGSEAVEVCRRAGVLYAEIDLLDIAVRVLKWGGQNVFAGQLLAKSGRHSEAVDLLAESGDLLAAAETARSAGEEKRAQELLAQRSENEGRLAEGAMHFEQAGNFPQAARLYELAGELMRAAQSHESASQHESAAQVYEQLGEIDQAARCLRAAGREAEANALTERTDHKEESVREYAASGDFMRAGAGLLTLARSGGGDPSLYAEAVAYLGRVDTDHVDYLTARVLLAEATAEQGDNHGALGILQNVLAGGAASVAHVPALYQYGRLLEREGYLAGARNAYQTAANFDSRYRDLQARLEALGESGRPALAAQPIPSPPPVAVPVPPPRSESVIAGANIPAPPTAPMVVPTAPLMVGGIQEVVEAVPVAPPTAPESSMMAAIDEQLRNLTEDLEMEQPELNVELLQPQEPVNPGSLEGVVLRGRFRIEKRIGRGAQAQVYLARDQVLDRRVAIKVLSTDVAQDEAAHERFLREARLAARVHHTGCLAIFDFGEERGLTFMAMEYFRGRTIKALIKKGKLEPRLAIRIANDVAEALGAVHQVGIVHRDIKPTNILIDKTGECRLTDFGVARNIGEGTDSGLMVGTMKYMSPEQARGKEVNGRSDIFSLGVLLYEMVSGQAPFGGNLDDLIARVTKPPPDLPEGLEVPQIIHDCVKKCMERQPSRRYQTVKPLIKHLQEALDQLEEMNFSDQPTHENMLKHMTESSDIQYVEEIAGADASEEATIDGSDPVMM